MGVDVEVGVYVSGDGDGDGDVRVEVDLDGGDVDGWCLVDNWLSGLGQDRGSRMPIRSCISEAQWARVEQAFAARPHRGRPGGNDRQFFEAVLWWRRTGVPWRDMPSEFGPWKTVFNRFDRWSKKGWWSELLVALQTDIDDEWQCIDSTTNRAHQHAAGGRGGPASTASADHGAV